MKKLFLGFLLLSTIAKGQDSIRTKVLDYKRIPGTDTIWYKVKNLETGEKVYTKCCCGPYKKGTIRKIARKDEYYFEERITNPLGY